MQSLQQKAAEWSGVNTDDAFAIDDTNLFEKLGLQTFINLSTNFYNRVFGDEEEWFRSIFANSKKEDAIQNQYEFFVQRMGGPPLYSQRKGHPALIGRHRPFPVTHRAAERWLHHMQQALDSSSDIDQDSKTKMMNFFRHTAFFLVAGDELKNQNQGVVCKHATSKPGAVYWTLVGPSRLISAKICQPALSKNSFPRGKLDGSANQAEKDLNRLSGSIVPDPSSKFCK